MTDDSLTARNRINQRNFRARRQNYIKELEERIRKYESEGVQATIEIQAAARQVTDQNIKLRNLLIQQFGMSEFEIANYLGFQPTSPSIQNQPLPNVFNGAPQLANLAPTPFGNIAPRPPSNTDTALSYPTPPQQSDLPRAVSSAVLDPALGLVSLHRYSSSTYEHGGSFEQNPTRQNSQHSSGQTTDIASSSYDARRADSPADTVSESSNPETPAEQPQINGCQPNPLCSQPEPRSDPSLPLSSLGPRIKDETTCEEAARIIASMRGGDGSPDQVLLELGCPSPDSKCKVRNISIFQLMDR